jgi:superfamily II DNA or RNA helicase
VNLRSYQTQAVDAVLRDFQSVQSTLVCCPTGTGKSLIFAEVVRRLNNGDSAAIVIAHRQELLNQAQRTIEAHAGLDCEYELGERKASEIFPAPVLLASVQTLCSGRNGARRMHKFSPHNYGLLVIDECFPAGTLIDGRPIETIERGDGITTHLGFGTVTATMKRQCEAVMRITLSDGRRITCTPNHPVWTPNGFMAASKLTTDSMVLTITNESMSDLQETYPDKALPESIVPKRTLSENHPIDISETRRDNALQENERNEQAGSQGISVIEASPIGTQTTNSRRKRKATASSTGCNRARTRMANRTSYPNENTQRQWISDLLQGGHWQLCPEDCDRSGRFVARHFIEAGPRQEERRVFAFARVARVEVFKRGSGQRFSELCPDGFVYNLTVSNGNTYFAEGVLVHNCHHGVASSYREVIKYFKANKDLKILGVTATPERADEEALGQICESVAFDLPILQAVSDGWLVPVQQQLVDVQSLDFSHVRTTAGDLNGADLAAVMESERNLYGICDATMKELGNRKAIMFTVSVKQAEMAADILNRYKAGVGRFASGKTPVDERRSIMQAFSEGSFQVLVNCNLVSEGFDVPDAELLIQARPTKSKLLYTQQLGRIMRPLSGTVDFEQCGASTTLNEGGDASCHPETSGSNAALTFNPAARRRQAIANSAKPIAVVMDFVGNAGRHKLIHSLDILGGDISPRIRELAERELRKTGKPTAIDEILRDAEELEQKEKQRQESARRARLTARATFTTRIISPFEAFDMCAPPTRSWNDGKTLSTKQRELLRKQSIDPDRMSYSEGKTILNELFRRWSNGLCSLKQAALLKKRGVETKELTRDKASQLITEIATQEGWHK